MLHFRRHCAWANFLGIKIVHDCRRKIVYKKFFDIVRPRMEGENTCDVSIYMSNEKEVHQKSCK